MEKIRYTLLPGREVFADIATTCCGESFKALERDIDRFSLWFSEGNNDSAKADILRGSIHGELIFSTLIPKGPAGKRTVIVPEELFLERGQTYFLRLSKGAPGMTSGSLAAFGGEGIPMGSGRILATGTNLHMALEIIFVPGTGKNPVQKKDPAIEPEYISWVNSLLRDKRDGVGEKLMEEGNISYDSIKDMLKPSMLVGTCLTATGIYYVPLGYPGCLCGAGDFALCVADGSEIISSRVTGLKTSFYLDRELFGHSLSRLKEPRLLGGYLPCLINEYEDCRGNVYIKETFTGKVEETEGLVAFVKIEKIKTTGDSMLRIKPGDGTYHISSKKLLDCDNMVFMMFSRTPVLNDGYLELNLDLNSPLYMARYNNPSPFGSFSMDGKRYEKELVSMKDYWEKTLKTDTEITVPERRVMDAKKNLLIQNLCLGYRYSIGNQYEDFFQPESSDTADVLGAYGHTRVYRAILNALIDKFKPGAPYGNWERGEKLAHGARYYAITGDFSFIEENKETYFEYLDYLEVQILKNPDNLPDRQVFSGDISEPSLYVHWLCVIYRGFKDMYHLFLDYYPQRTKKYGEAFKAFEKSLFKRIRESIIEIDKDTAFIPHTLSENDMGFFDPITKTRIGSYWNLCIPYALTSGVIPYGSPLAKKIFNYMLGYGTWLLGLLRFNYYPVESTSHMEGGLPGYATEGADNVYGVNLAEFLSHMEDPERLILMFYSKLAHGMTRGTYISGEGDTIGVYPGEYYRSMYLPPNSANNSLFLKLLRLLLLNEQYDRDFSPVSLDICPATPSHWLEDKKSICVKNAPTLFGPVSFKYTSHIVEGYVRIWVDFPHNKSLASSRVYFRLPKGLTTGVVLVNGEVFDSLGDRVKLVRPRGSYDILVKSISKV